MSEPDDLLLDIEREVERDFDDRLELSLAERARRDGVLRVDESTYSWMLKRHFSRLLSNPLGLGGRLFIMGIPVELI